MSSLSLALFAVVYLLSPAVLAAASKELTQTYLGVEYAGAPSYAAEADIHKHGGFQMEVKRLEAENSRRVEAVAAETNSSISEGETIRRQLAAAEAAARQLGAKEKEVFSTWSRAQHELEALAASMMERLNASDAFMALTRTRLGAARRGRAEALARVEYLDRREQAADTRRREVVATRLALANELEALSANMTLMEEERKHALQAAAQRADAIKLEEAQYAQLEGDGAAERSALWGLDERLRQLRATTPNALAAAAAAVAIYNP